MMNRSSIRWFLSGVLLALAFSWSAGETLAGRQWQDGTGQLLSQGGQKVTGFFKSMNTKGVKWTVTLESLNHKTKQAYPLAADIALTYKGRPIPWQKGIIIDSIVELFLERDEVKVINVVEWSS